VSNLRWYVDADTLGLARILIQVRQDVTFPGDDGKRPHHKRDVDPCLVTDTSTDDEVWIPQVARAGLAIITRDRRIQDRVGERDTVVAEEDRPLGLRCGA
jgi:hypothetical protein